MQSSLTLNRNERWVYIILFLFLWIYLWLRAALIPFSHDEIATFFHYIHSERFIPFVNMHWYANNHLLNTVLAFCFYKLFGVSELILRLPNLLFFPVFFFFVYKLSQEIKNLIWRWLFVIVLCFAHYFIEFFALCRGYGIAMASLVASVYFLMQAIKTNETRNYLYCLLFATMASMANLTLINSNALIIFLLGMNLLLQFKNTAWKNIILKSLVILFTGIIPLGLLARFAMELQIRGLLDVGTHDGFWQVTIKSNTLVFTNSDNLLIGYYVIFFFAVICLFFVLLFLKDKSLKFFHNSRFVFLYLLLGNLFITLFLGNFFNVNYPEDRAAMYFFPLLVGSFCFLADDVSGFINSKISAVIAAPALLLTVHFFLNINVSYASFWKNLRIPYRFHDKVKEYVIPGQPPPTVAGYKMRGYAWNFINFRRGNILSQIHYEGYPDVNADFQLALMEHRSDWLQYYDSLDYDKYSEIWLLKRKTAPVLSLVADRSGLATGENYTNEFWNLYEGTVDSLAGKTLIINYDLSLLAYENPFTAQVIAAVSDKDNKSLRYEWLQFDFLQSEYNGEPHNFVKNSIIHNLPAEAHSLVIYVWNIRSKPYSIKDARCRIETMK